MVSRAVAVSLLKRLAAPKHQEELLEYIHSPEELDMRKEFNRPVESLEELDMRREFNRPVESLEELDMCREFNRLAELQDRLPYKEELALHLELRRQVVLIMEWADSTADSTANLLDIPRVVPILPTITLNINI